MKGAATVTLTPDEWGAVLELRAAFHGIAELVWLTAEQIREEPESVGMSRDRLRALVALADHADETPLDVTAIDRRYREGRTRVISLDLRPETAAKLEAEASREGISAAAMMVRIVRAEVAKRKAVARR